MGDRSPKAIKGNGRYPSFDGADDMARRLAECIRDVEENAFRMNRAIDAGNPKEAIQFAQNMLKELRVGNLSPKTYYELWMKTFDYLRQLHSFFLDLSQKGSSVADLYQHVQGTSNIIPRLYLMITVGAIFISTKGAPAMDVLQDLIEMTKGVQHPMRGLFLRNYLLKMTQDKLNLEYDVPTDYCVKFILQNLGEMNRLWVRMQHQGNANNKNRREKERMELKVLISFNLVQLSELEEMDVDLYKGSVLDQILEIVTSCKDKIAQQYLMDVLVQVFPASYHLATLTNIYESFEHLEPTVDLKAILLGLMNRVKYLGDEGEDDEEETDLGDEKNENTKDGKKHVSADSFLFLKDCTEKLLAARQDLSIEDKLDLYVALLDFAVSCFPGELSYIDTILATCSGVVESATRISANEDSLILELLRVPLRQSELNMLSLLGLSCYPNLMSKLSWNSKKKVAQSLLQQLLRDSSIVFDSEAITARLFSFIAPLVKDDEQHTSSPDDNSFEEQQMTVAKLIHRFYSSDTQVMFQILAIARKEFGRGGVHRIKYTLVPLCFRYMFLVRMVLAQKGGAQDEHVEEEMSILPKDTGDVNLRKLFQYIHEICSALAGVVELQDVALRMFTQAALCANEAGDSEIAYEFLAQAFTLYEDVADSKEQIRLLPMLIGALQTTTVFDKENYTTLITKTTQYAIRLLKKPDQVQMVLICSHLFWSTTPVRELRNGETPPQAGADGKRALECLQRSLKIADSCLSSQNHVNLFVKILNRYVYFMQAGMDKVVIQNIVDLVTLVKRNLADMENGPEKSQVETHFANTCKHLNSLKAANPEKYGGLEI